MVGTTYGKWTIENLINDSSGNGVVWRVSSQDGVQGAIKILKSFEAAAKLEKRRNRFVNEIYKLGMIQKLGISGVMPILDYDEKAEPPWFVMPLAHSLEPGENRLEWALETMITITRCIADLHKEGMVHRDIKPNNILVLDGAVVVSDFGLARVADDVPSTKTGEAVGSFGYTAPECVGHSDEPQFKCDVYALAKTAWVLFTGKESPPNGELRHPNDSIVARGIASSTISLEGLDDLLIASTVRDPEDRPTAKQFLEGLEACRLSGNNLKVRQSGSPAKRAKSLFADQAARNRRDRESKELFQSIVNEASRKFFEAWRGVIEELGWSTAIGSGGTGGNHSRELENTGWSCPLRSFYTGEINGKLYDIALTFCRLQTMGEARLVCRATIGIQVASDEYVIKYIERETFTSGPKRDQVRQEIFEFVESEEIQYRTIEKLRELSNDRDHCSQPNS